MSKLRFRVVETAFKKKAVEVATPAERPSEYFGKYVFNKEKMFRYLPSKVYAKLIKENISSKVQLHTYDDDIYTYEEAIERYKLCLANAVVKRAHASEKAYICLKSGWLMRGYHEYLEESGDTDMARLREVKNMEEAYLKNAYTGFTEALQTEGFPMCGMDEITVELDMRARLVELNEAQAIVRGPLVLARDSRF